MSTILAKHNKTSKWVKSSKSKTRVTKKINKTKAKMKLIIATTNQNNFLTKLLKNKAKFFKIIDKIVR